MPELAHPFWLLGLLLVPAVRWLHRLNAPGHPLRVPALFLWRDAVTAAAAGRRRGPPDPAWRHRALLVALAALALAGPGWTVPASRTAEVWIDDGPALFARERGGADRIEEAARSLAGAALDGGVSRLRLKALRRPGESVDLTAADARTIEDRLRAWLAAPGRGPVSAPAGAGDEPRWLLSSGSDPDALAGVAAARFARVIRVGTATDNQAVVGLSIRPSLTAADRLVGLVEIGGAGASPASRALTVSLDGEVLEAVRLAVPANGSVTHAFAVPPAGHSTLAARLEPAPTDSLPIDDGLSLPLGQARRPATIVVEGRCDPAVATLVAAHPGLRVVDAGAELAVRCVAEPPRGDLPTLWVVPGEAGEVLVEPPVWDIERAAAAPSLAGERIRAVRSAAAPEGRAVLRAGTVPLVLEQDSPRRVTLLLETGGLRDRAEMPVLLGFLLDRLAGRELLLPVARVARDPAEIRVAPGPLPQALDAGTGRAGRLELSPWLIAGALGLALYDLARRVRAAFAA